MAKSNEATDRRARLEQIKREQQAKERKRAFLGAAVVAAILLLIVGGVIYGTSTADTTKTQSHDEIVPAAVVGNPVDQGSTPAQVTAPSVGIDGLLAWDTKGYPGEGTADAGTLTHQHVAGPVTYAITPPVGGNHNGIWANAGVYAQPIPSERAVHLLEHGAVWITYNPSLPKDQIQKLQDLVGKQSMFDESNGNRNRYIVMSPWASDTLPAPIVISSWGFQLRVTSPDDARLQKFIDTFRHSTKYTPETSAGQFPPVDGNPTGTAGNPAIYGSENPNPAGTANTGM